MPVNNFTKHVRGLIRAKKKRKSRFSPQGGGFAAQAKRSKVNKDYQGLPKALRSKLRIKK